MKVNLFLAAVLVSFVACESGKSVCKIELLRGAVKQEDVGVAKASEPSGILRRILAEEGIDLSQPNERELKTSLSEGGDTFELAESLPDGYGLEQLSEELNRELLSQSEELQNTNAAGPANEVAAATEQAEPQTTETPKTETPQAEQKPEENKAAGEKTEAQPEKKESFSVSFDCQGEGKNLNKSGKKGAFTCAEGQKELKVVYSAAGAEQKKNTFIFENELGKQDSIPLGEQVHEFPEVLGEFEYVLNEKDCVLFIGSAKLFGALVATFLALLM